MIDTIKILQQSKENKLHKDYKEMQQAIKRPIALKIIGILLHDIHANRGKVVA